MDGKAFVDERRALIAVGGGDRAAFLQGLVTNDVGLVAPGRAVWTALLTPQGKYLFDFFLLDGGFAGREAILIDVAADRAQALGQRLSMYRLRRDVTVSGVDGLGVALLWGGAPGTLPEGSAALPDPRDARLGHRLYGPDPEALIAGTAPGSRAEHDALRVAALVPETGRELLPDESYILEQGFADLGGVDFRKGCYVGQEVTARMRHKTELKKRLVRVAVTGEAVPGAELLTGEGKVAGRLGTVAGDRGLAHLRLDRAEGTLRAGSAEVRMIS